MLHSFGALKARDHFVNAASQAINLVLRRQAYGEPLTLFQITDGDSLGSISYTPERT
jgi:hypothetical protein